MCHLLLLSLFVFTLEGVRMSVFQDAAALFSKFDGRELQDLSLGELFEYRSGLSMLDQQTDQALFNRLIHEREEHAEHMAKFTKQSQPATA